MQSTLMLAFNFLPLKTAWQIGLHEPNARLCSAEENGEGIGFTSPVTGYSSDPRSVVHSSLYFGPRYVSFYRCPQ